MNTNEYKWIQMNISEYNDMNVLHMLKLLSVCFQGLSYYCSILPHQTEKNWIGCITVLKGSNTNIPMLEPRTLSRLV